MSTEEEDAELIDRLYGGEDVGGLGAVRGLIARVREEQPGVEPPQAIGAKLLLAAQEHAPKKVVVAEKPGLWARVRAWMTPLVAHPGMAAAATLVVVAGATAVWMSRGGEVAEPVRREARAPEPEGAAAGSAGADTATVTTESAPAAAAVPLDPKPLDEKKQAGPATTATSKPAPKRDAPAPAKKQRAKADLATGTARGGEGSGGAAFGDSEADDSLRQEPAAGVKAKVGGSTADEAPSPRPAQQPSAPPPPPPEKPAEDESKNEERAPSRVRRLFDQARAAAKQGDCKRVEALGAEVKKLDASYYAKTFSTDASIAACRTPAAPEAE